MEIRLMNIDDIEFFNKVRNESVDYLHDNTKYTIEDNIKWFNTLNDPFFIMLVDDERIGYIRTSNWESNEPYVGMDIATEFRDNGYSQKFYPKLFNKLMVEFNVKRVYLEVLETNIRAKHIYNKLGFVEVSSELYNNTNSIKMKLDL